MLRIVFVFWILIPLGMPVHAQHLSDDDVAAIQLIEDANRTAMFEERFELMAESLSMSIFDEMGAATGLTGPESRDSFLEMMTNGAEFYDVVEYELFIEDRTEGQTITGRTYALVPMRSVVAFVDGRTVQADTTVLFFEDEGRWYWSRIDNSIGLSMTQAAYPDFAGLAQAEITVTQVE